MNKFKIGLLVLGLLGMTSTVKAELGAQVNKPYNNTHVGVASATVYTGSGVLYGLDLSSGAITDWVMAFDTVVIQSLSGVNAFGDATRITVATQFSTNTAIATNGQLYPGSSGKVDFGPKGVFFKKGLFIYKTNASSGESTRVNVRWSE